MIHEVFGKGSRIRWREIRTESAKAAGECCDHFQHMKAMNDLLTFEFREHQIQIVDVDVEFTINQPSKMYADGTVWCSSPAIFGVYITGELI